MNCVNAAANRTDNYGDVNADGGTNRLPKPGSRCSAWDDLATGTPDGVEVAAPCMSHREKLRKGSKGAAGIWAP